MAQFPNARIPFGRVLQAIADQLVKDGVAGDAAAVTWGTPKSVPQFTGPWDILLIARSARPQPRDGGPAQFQAERYVDIFYRSEGVPDPGGGWKEWIASVFVAGDKILCSVGCDGFQPEDEDGNLLTVLPIMFAGDAAPDYVKSGAAFGDYVLTLSVVYMPAIDPTKGVFPIP